MEGLPPRKYKTCSSRYGRITEIKTKNYRTSVIYKRGWYPSQKWYAAFASRQRKALLNFFSPPSPNRFKG